MKNIKETLKVAQTFINRVENLLKKSPSGDCYYSNPKEQGALRRASMELTRALAEMRKP